MTKANIAILPQDSPTLRIEEVLLPDPKPNQVVVKQYASGICHSQLHQIHAPRKTPVLLGHESTGVVTKVGNEVTHVCEGDTVMVTWVPRNVDESSMPPEPISLSVSDGTAVAQNVFTWADHTIADQQFVVKVDPAIKKDVTSIIGCAVMTGAGAVINTAKVKAGQSVSIFGVGGVGLSAVVAAKKVGETRIRSGELVHILQHGACQRTGQSRPLLALQRPCSAKRDEPMVP